MKKLTKSYISLSDIPKELSNHPLLNGHVEHTYVEMHISGEDKNNPHDELTKWLIKTYPNLKRKISFLIHID